MPAVVRDLAQQGCLPNVYSLRVIDADFSEGPQHFLVFHAFGNGLDSHHPADSLDSLDDSAIDRVGADVSYKAAVDLQIVDGQRLEIREGGHAAAEVIERNRRAEPAQASHQLRGAGQVADGRGLSQLKADLRAGQAVLAQAAADVVRQAGIADRSAGKIDHAHRQPAAR